MLTIVLAFAIGNPTAVAQLFIEAEIEEAKSADPSDLHESGLKKLLSGKEPEAGHSLLIRAAHHGSAIAAQDLGFLYAAGRLVPRDIENAARYFELAVAQDEPNALIEYGMHLYHGLVLPMDKERGKELIQRAAQLGNPVGSVFLVDILKQSGNQGDLEIAIAWTEMLDEEAAAYAQAAISVNYRDGEMFPPDPDAGSYWLDQIEPDLLPDALARVALFYGNRHHVRTNQHVAVSLFEDAIRNGDGWIINNYAWLLSTSPDASIRNGQKAIELMEELLARSESRASWTDTLAAAYAEIGNFGTAIAIQDEAIELFDDENAANIGGAYERRLTYVEGRPWRE